MDYIAGYAKGEPFNGIYTSFHGAWCDHWIPDTHQFFSGIHQQYFHQV
jgi:hypothetical protein